MHRRLWFWSSVLAALLAAGCGRSSLIAAKGRVIKNGEPFHTQRGEGLRIVFVPLDPPQGSRYESFAAEYEPKSGTFRVRGKDGQGLPPGKYRVTMELMKKKEDQFGGSLTGNKSPFVCEVTGRGNDLVIDLDQANLDGRPKGAKPLTSGIVR